MTDEEERRALARRTADSIRTSRRFPAPWTCEGMPGGFKVIDANGLALGFFYGHSTQEDADIAKGLTMDEARRIASNVAKLPDLLQSWRGDD